ncbi:unnamed protein product [Rodentolepis nana]|uniref:Fork-head domain-containing protein n=1 Tax=Rodentolepis nana TaxID=102285 RepID=A0A0R3T260_RODNA|nr:unnamed protein product [Rodentolepis nana]
MSISDCVNSRNASQSPALVAASASNLIIQSEVSQQSQHQQSDLVPLNWLQGSDIIHIAPLDQEEDTTRASTPGTPTYRVRNQSQTVPQALPVTVNQGYPIIVTTAPNFNTSAVVNTFDDSNVKPGISYTHLICMAIESSANKCMTVQEIYNWCQKHYAYFRNSNSGWKNSLRHNLSINKYFKKLPRDVRGPGRGNFWTIDPSERSNLLESIRRAPPLPTVRSIALQPITAISTQLTTLSSLPTSTGSLIITSASVPEDRTPPKLHVNAIPEDRSTKDSEHTVYAESESIGATEVCGSVTPSQPVGFESWSAEEDAKFEESKRQLFGSMGTQTSGIASQEPVKESKNRRKSSLQTNQLMCERCKNAVVSSCQRCSLLRQVRRMGSLKDVLSSLDGEGKTDSTRMDQVLNFLDDDQEAPSSSWSKPSVTTEETFIVNAPHMDHEYCSFQQYLRSQEDKRVVQSVNAEIRDQQVELLRELAATNYDMEGLSFEDERENEEPKGARRYVKCGEKHRLNARSVAAVPRKRGKERVRKMELEYENDDEEEYFLEMPPYTGHYKSRNRYTCAFENDQNDDFDDLEEDGYHAFSRRAPASSLSRTRKRRVVEESDSALPPPSLRRRVEENSSRLPTEYGDVTAPPSGHPSSPSKDLPSSKRGGRKGNRRFDRN